MTRQIASTFDDLQELGLAKPGGQRSALVRVLLDGFTRDDGPRRRGEIRQFEELMLNLLGEADAFTRAVVAQRLAGRSDAPPALIQMLALDETGIAEPILAASPLLTKATMERIAARGGDWALGALSRRSDLPDTLRARLDGLGLIPAQRPPAVVSSPPAAAAPMPAASAPMAGIPAPDAERPVESLPEIPPASAFLNEAPAARRRILSKLRDTASARAHPPASEDTAQALIRFAILRQRDQLIRALAEALDTSERLARRIADDPDGEPMVVAARALQLHEDALAQLLLLGTPAIAHSVEKVYALRALYREVTVSAASELIAHWRGESRPPRHAPLFAEPRNHADQMRQTPQVFGARKVFGRAGPR